MIFFLFVVIIISFQEANAMKLKMPSLADLENSPIVLLVENKKKEQENFQGTTKPKKIIYSSKIIKNLKGNFDKSQIELVTEFHQDYGPYNFFKEGTQILAQINLNGDNYWVAYSIDASVDALKEASLILLTKSKDIQVKENYLSDGEGRAETAHHYQVNYDVIQVLAGEYTSKEFDFLYKYEDWHKTAYSFYYPHASLFFLKKSCETTFIEKIKNYFSSKKEECNTFGLVSKNAATLFEQ